MKIIQITAAPNGLYALIDNGDVWYRPYPDVLNMYPCWVRVDEPVIENNH